MREINGTGENSLPSKDLIGSPAGQLAPVVKKV